MSQEKKQQRIYWTEDEIEKVLEEAIKLYFEDRNIWSHFIKAQGVLPQNRQRNIVSRSCVSKDLIDLFCQKRQEILEQGVPFEVSIEVPVPKEVLVERPREEVLKGISTRELMCLLAERLAPFIDGLPTLVQGIKVTTNISETPFKDGSHKTSSSTSTTVHKTRVFMYGFLASQKNDILEKAAGFNLELIFRKKEGKIFDPPASCNYCLVINKINHPAWNAMKAKFSKKGKGRIQLVTGISDALKELADINAQVGMMGS
ncbi:MAG: hypothetical protein PHN69_06335 [Candidatus Pacebacteria bacterium]|nr:hypothetical protein [Candidatus Paceibacterota bacterium]